MVRVINNKNIKFDPEFHNMRGQFSHYSLYYDIIIKEMS